MMDRPTPLPGTPMSELDTPAQRWGGCRVSPQSVSAATRWWTSACNPICRNATGRHGVATVISRLALGLAACANQYDYTRAVRDGRLEGYWPLSARGRFD